MKIRIAHIITSFSGGGAERLAVNLCNELSKNKTLEVYLVVMFDVQEHMFLQNDVYPEIQILTLSKTLGLDFKVFTKLYKLFGKIKPDIVNTHLTGIDYNVLNLIFNKGVKYYHTIHSEALMECPKAYKRLLRKFFFKRNVTPITISERSSESFRKTYELKNDTLIYNGRSPLTKTQKFSLVVSEFESYKITPQTKVFLNIAHLVSVKGHIKLLKAFNKLILDGEDVVLILIGDRRHGDDQIFNAINHYKNNRIHYLGIKQNIADYLYCADALCIASDVEGMPITLIEAMATCCIPIVTPAGGIPNMITNNKNGLLAENLSEKAIFDAIKRFLSLNVDALDTIKKQLIIDYNTIFTIEKAVDSYLKLYQILK